TLEAIAQAIFKEWFVDFNFPGATGEMEDSELGLIPAGWRVYKLEELIESISITHKFDNSHIIFLNTSDIEEGRVLHHNYRSVDGLPGQAKKSIRKFDILFTEIRPANKRFALIDFDAKEYVVSTKLMVLRVKAHVQPIVIYNYITSTEVLSRLQMLAESRSGTFPQITFDQVKELQIALPTDELLKKYTSLCWSFFQEIKNNEQQNVSLAQTRDTLLPKLIHGELEA
ncbi:MAG: restriction endonuclease subunit S, partial [Anaerolineae bacterium]|nr:restriction endonuclease subunit S [Anaerolineae bacterium]